MAHTVCNTVVAVKHFFERFFESSKSFASLVSRGWRSRGCSGKRLAEMKSNHPPLPVTGLAARPWPRLASVPASHYFPTPLLASTTQRGCKSCDFKKKDFLPVDPVWRISFRRVDFPVSTIL
jgi:hypothetical protein